MIAPRYTRPLLLSVCMALALCALARGQEKKEPAENKPAVATAPPNMVPWGKTREGSYFVDKELLERYEACRARLAEVRDAIARGDATSDAATKSLDEIQRDAEALRKELEAKKVLVAAYQVFSQTSETTFPLSDERLVIITGDHVIVRGWEGPGIKCVLEKTIISQAPPAASEFDAINVQHEVMSAKEMVGSTQAERDEQERKFAESELAAN